VSAPFSAQLRARPDAIEIGPADGERWTVRVQVAEAWDAVRVVAPPTTAVLDVKRRALDVLRPDAAYPDDFVVKLRGIEVPDESASLADAGAADGSIFLVMYRRRRPVR
jgi:hypothetical protein